MALAKHVTEHLHDALLTSALVRLFYVDQIIHGNIYQRLRVGSRVYLRLRIILLVLRLFLLLFKLTWTGTA